MNSIPLDLKQVLLSVLTHDGIKQEVSGKAREYAELFQRSRTDHPVVRIGTATCGLSAGAGKTLTKLRELAANDFPNVEIVETGCIGLCAEEPIVDIQLPGRPRVAFRKITAGKAAGLLDSVLNHRELPAESLLGQFRDSGSNAWETAPFLDELPFFRKQTRNVLRNCGILDPGSIEEYLAYGGYRAFARSLHTMTPLEICDEVERSGLRGRGGAGFPTGTKWKTALNRPSDQKYMICNADEGDPGAFMDRALMESDPHRLIEGLAIASYAIGASRAYIYVRAEYKLAIRRLTDALAQARAYGLLGENILDSGFDLKILLKKGAGAFVCGEETALINSMEGKRGTPRPRPPYPAVKGLFGKPSVINNVETLANLPGIILNGEEWFRSIGTERSKGTKVFALSGKIVNTGLIEVAMGTRLRDIICEIGGGVPNRKKFKAVQIGGPSGGCIPAELLDLEIDYETLRSAGAIMGSGGLVAMDENTCMVDVAKFFMDFVQNESCGKCIPCREGTRHLREILERITHGRKQETGNDALIRFKSVIELRNLAQVIKETSLCGLGQTAPNPVLSTLRWFRDEYEAHIFERRCPAGVCRELVRYEILEDRCRGCTVCAAQCPAKAITGSPRHSYRIEESLCTGCGKCREVCKFNAVALKQGERHV